MGTYTNALLLFSKLPEPGKVKTRLTPLKDGVFPPEDAAELYACMLLDVIDVCMAAFSQLDREAGARHEGPGDREAYRLVVSTTPAESVSPMRALLDENGPWPYPVDVIADAGASFDEHYNDAFEQTWEMGADCILSMGADMPALTVDDVVRGFEALWSQASAGGGIVLAPDQEMGVSVVGWTRDTDFDHTGVFYNPSGLTVLPAYIAKARAANVPATYLPPVPDVDTMADLMHNVTLVEALCYCTEADGGPAPHRTAAKLAELGIDEVRVMPNALMDPRDAIDA